ncbi:LLM class flavin-dependent oxidoreductase [Paenibacillus sp. LMG 31456]|uniref:LLM class flavin-dependent oxidoreductase n=1 Tax=Paenibacillus foliorum TaxID=2654974 RepID=A0A972K1R5_9BACL|nr:LLM class flavin-dependent oxidoreductase [Paenibacillus foliorum]NOU94148.1 LLM class flavin-dependent oxidoreductase [Paenibacillus foliorum]
MGNSIDASVEFGWFIPTTGDGKYIGVKPERESTSEYMIQVAQTAENAGFTFALIPTGGSCIDSWIVGSAIATHTKILKPLVAMRPGLIAPVLAARMAASLDYISNGRALINVVTGGSPQDLKATGDPLANAHDDRYERTLEFLQIVKGVWNGSKQSSERYLAGSQNYQESEPVHFKGKYYEIEGGASLPAPVQNPHPPLYFGGSSPAGKKTAVETADVYLMWTEPLDWIKEQIAEMEQLRVNLKAEKGIDRELKYGLRAQVLIRETEEEAWREAWDIISKIDRKAIEQSGQRFTQTDATNQKRQNELREQSKENDYILGPNLWAGISLVRGGGSMLLVGTPEQLSDRLLEYIEAGISSFVLSGYPNLEEAETTGRLLLPEIKRRLSERTNSSQHIDFIEANA